ncbi:MAG: lysophospholipid acyltransferase family protein [Eubacteriales bacterium]|nr:lysophospholipid acyltransferase family protein [Eubacteriales bacterium]
MKFHPKFQAIAIPVVNVYDHLKYDYHVIGRENVPEDGCVVIANHTQWADPVLIATAMGNKYPIVAMAKKELFAIKPLAPLITALGAFPVDRGTADIGAIKTSLKAIKEGKKLLIFPEGTTKHAEGDAAKEGAAMIAARTGAPILPIYVSENKKFRSKVYVVIGKPFVPEKTRTKEGYRKLADEMMKRVYALKENL